MKVNRIHCTMRKRKGQIITGSDRCVQKNRMPSRITKNLRVHYFQCWAAKKQGDNKRKKGGSRRQTVGFEQSKLQLKTKASSCLRQERRVTIAGKD